MFEFNSLMLWNLQAVGIDFAIIFVLFISLRILKGVASNVRATDEIATRDNFAFGVAYAGGLGALAIMLTGASTGAFGHTLADEAINMVTFGVFGIVLIIIGRMIQDKVVLSKVDIHGEIANGNLSAAFVDVGNMLSVAIVIKAAMSWVETEGFAALPVVGGAFVVSQIILMIASKYRVRLFKMKNSEGDCMQKAMEEGNKALSLRYAGYLLGTSLSITAASGFVAYDPDHVWVAIGYWAVFALIIMVVYAIIQLIAMKLILPGVDISDEVDRQNNIGVAAIELAVSVAIGMVLVVLLV